MGAEDRQHAHVLLRVVELVEAPQHAGAVVREVHGPVARRPWRRRSPRSQPNAAPRPSGAGRSTAATCRATCTIASVSPVTSGTTRIAFTTVKRRSWRYPRAKIGRGCAGQVRSTTRNTPMIARVAGPATTARRLSDRAGEVGTAPITRPTDPEQDPGGDGDHTGREVHARREREPQAARHPVATLDHSERGSTGGLDYPGGHDGVPVSTRATRTTRPRCRRSWSACPWSWWSSPSPRARCRRRR